MKCFPRRVISFLIQIGLLITVVPTATEASSISLSVQFGSDGIGTFVYNDDNGGANRGFEYFKIDFSATNPSLSNLTLASSVPFDYGATNARFGLGGSDAQDLFRLFTDPTHNGAQYLSFSNPDFLLSITGQSADPNSRTSVSIGGLCTTPGTPGGGAYSFCTPTQTGFGLLNPPLAVPETTSLLLLGFGFTGIVLVKVRVHSPKPLSQSLPHIQPARWH